MCNQILFIKLCLSKFCFLMERERSSFLWDMTLSRTAVWILIALCGKALSALTHRWHHRSPQCCAAGGTNWGDSQCKRGRMKTQGSATDRAHHHVCVTQNHWRQRGRFPSTQWFISYVNIMDYTFDTPPKLDERDSWSVTWRIFSLFLFSTKEVIWHIQWSTITNRVSHGRVLRRRQ